MNDDNELHGKETKTTTKRERKKKSNHVRINIILPILPTNIFSSTRHRESPLAGLTPELGLPSVPPTSLAIACPSSSHGFCNLAIGQVRFWYYSLRFGGSDIVVPKQE